MECWMSFTFAVEIRVVILAIICIKKNQMPMCAPFDIFSSRPKVHYCHRKQKNMLRQMPSLDIETARVLWIFVLAHSGFWRLLASSRTFSFLGCISLPHMRQCFTLNWPETRCILCSSEFHYIHSQKLIWLSNWGTKHVCGKEYIIIILSHASMITLGI